MLKHWGVARAAGLCRPDHLGPQVPSVQTAFYFNGWWEDVARAVRAQL